MNGNFIDIYRAISHGGEEKEIGEIIALNEKTAEYGMVLTRKDVEEIVAARREALKNSGRVEIACDLAMKLIEAFYDSPYIEQSTYKNTINRLIDLFYEVKNETEDLISDGEAIAFMKKSFNGECNGSLELLAYKMLPEFAATIRREKGKSMFDGLTSSDDD